MNIKLNYLYRDASNYKQFNEVIFANPKCISLEKIQNTINSNLIEGKWFVAKHWNLPDVHFKDYLWDPQEDHDWHELIGVKETEELPSEKPTITDFLTRIKTFMQNVPVLD